MPDDKNGDAAVCPKIDSLTEEQDRALSEFIGDWFCRVVKGTTPKKIVEAAIASTYAANQCEAPGVLWCESPFQMAIMEALCKLYSISPSQSFFDNIIQQFTQPDWQRARDNLLERITELGIKPGEGQQEGWGEDRTTVVAITNTFDGKTALETLAPHLSLRVKLRIREAFSGPRIGLERAERQMVITQFGALPWFGLLGNSFSTDLLSQLDSQTQSSIKDTCKTHLSAPLGFGQQSEPQDALFSMLTDMYRTLRTPELAALAFIVQHLNLPLPEENKAVGEWLTIVSNVFHIQMNEKLCVVCELPVEVHLNERERLHNPDGPAMRFVDGTCVFALDGVVLPAVAILPESTVTIEQIESATNAEVRRVLIQRYGMDKFLADSGTVPFHADESGVLYRKQIQNDEPIVVVRVVNPTPDVDGSHAFYFLRVPPYMTTAKAAVAWTFTMSAEEYCPMVQS